MPEAKYIFSAADGSNTISVYDDADLQRRLDAAADAGVAVTYRPAND